MASCIVRPARRTVFAGLFVLLTLSTNLGCGGGSTAPPRIPTLASPTARAITEVFNTAPRDISAAKVRVEWSLPENVPTDNIIEYRIFRDGQIVGVTGPNETTFTDSIPTDDQPQKVRYHSVQTNPTGGNDTLVETEVAVPKLTTGQPHVYRVTVLYRQYIANSFGTFVRYREISSPTDSGQTTPIPRPIAVLPTGVRDLRVINVAFGAVVGADEYVVEFSTTTDFKNKVVRQWPGVITDRDWIPFENRFSISEDFPGLPAETRIYYRIGGRNSLDSPGPLGSDQPNGDNFIYSAGLSSFTVAQSPPPVPE